MNHCQTRRIVTLAIDNREQNSLAHVPYVGTRVGVHTRIYKSYNRCGKNYTKINDGGIICFISCTTQLSINVPDEHVAIYDAGTDLKETVVLVSPWLYAKLHGEQNVTYVLDGQENLHVTTSITLQSIPGSMKQGDAIQSRRVGRDTPWQEHYPILNLMDIVYTSENMLQIVTSMTFQTLNSRGEITSSVKTWDEVTNSKPLWGVLAQPKVEYSTVEDPYRRHGGKDGILSGLTKRIKQTDICRAFSHRINIAPFEIMSAKPRTKFFVKTSTNPLSKAVSIIESHFMNLNMLGYTCRSLPSFDRDRTFMQRLSMTNGWSGTNRFNTFLVLQASLPQDQLDETTKNIWTNNANIIPSPREDDTWTLPTTIPNCRGILRGESINTSQPQIHKHINEILKRRQDACRNCTFGKRPCARCSSFELQDFEIQSLFDQQIPQSTSASDMTFLERLQNRSLTGPPPHQLSRPRISRPPIRPLPINAIPRRLRGDVSAERIIEENGE